MTLEQVKIDVSINEKEILDYLYSKGIFERGEILFPSKEIWSKIYTHITFFWTPVKGVKEKLGYFWCYKYITPKQKLYGKLLDTVTLEELKNFLKD